MFSGKSRSISSAPGFIASTFNIDVDGAESTTPIDTEDVTIELCDKVRESLEEKKLSSSALPQKFLLKCLVYHRLSVDPAVETSAGFLRFRNAANWPLIIPEDHVEKALQSGVHWLLPRRRIQNPAVDCTWKGNAKSADAGPAACIVLNMSALDTEKCTVAEYQKASCFLMEGVTDDLQVQQRGIALIIDFKGMQLSTFLSIVSMDDVRRGVMLWKGAFPCRLRRIWFIDAPYALRWLISGTLPLLKPHVRERARMAHRSSGLEEIQQDLGSLFDLPGSLGGEAVGNFDWEATLRACLNNPDGAGQAQGQGQGADMLCGKACENDDSAESGSECSTAESASECLKPMVQSL